MPRANKEKKTKKGKKKKAETAAVAEEENTVCDETVADFSKFVENVKQKLDFTSSDEGGTTAGSGEEVPVAEKSVLEDSTPVKSVKKKKKGGLTEEDEPRPVEVASFLKTPPSTPTSAFYRKAATAKTEKIKRVKKVRKVIHVFLFKTSVRNYFRRFICS